MKVKEPARVRIEGRKRKQIATGNRLLNSSDKFLKLGLFVWLSLYFILGMKSRSNEQTKENIMFVCTQNMLNKFGTGQIKCSA